MYGSMIKKTETGTIRLSIRGAEGGCKLQLANNAKMYVAQKNNSITIFPSTTFSAHLMSSNTSAI